MQDFLHDSLNSRGEIKRMYTSFQAPYKQRVRDYCCATSPASFTGKGTINGDSRSDGEYTPYQLLWQGVIWRAIDDALRPPLTKQQELAYRKRRKAPELAYERKAKVGEYAKITKILDTESTRQSAVDFLLDTDFPDTYWVAFGQAGERFQREIARIIENVRRKPGKSDYYRQIFNEMSR